MYRQQASAPHLRMRVGGATDPLFYCKSYSKLF